MSNHPSRTIARAIRTAGAAYEDLRAMGVTKSEALQICARGYQDTGYPGISCTGYSAAERSLFAQAASLIRD